jgi:gliding motility-associated-like protein
MRKRQLNIILVIFGFLCYNAYSQTNCTVPLPPVFTLVSVEPETGKTELKWTLSSSPDIAAYILYTYNDGVGMSIDTLWDPLATSYLLTSTATKYFSVSYVVAAHRLSDTQGMPGCTSPLSNALTTIFAVADIDTCNKKIKVYWNSYIPYPKTVIDYSVLLSINGGSYNEVAKLNPGEKFFTLNDFSANADYCFVVRANIEGGSFSTSNKTCLLTKMQRPPSWINADQATVNEDNKISLSFSIDPLSAITQFRLERKIGPNGIFQEIARPSLVNNSVIITDNQADVNIINYYRLSALNSCNIPITYSNLSSNLVLDLERRDNELNLSWNSYKEWSGGVSSYSLFINTGKGFVEKEVMQPTDTLFKLGYQEIMYEVTGDHVCFYISATEALNPYGVKGRSKSSEICITPTEIITVPNIFTPNNDLVNDFFRPVLSFTPLDYHLVISDRQGKILFETKDFNASWDGSQNGNPHPQDVCLWFLRVTTPTGKKISRTGTLTIINNR